MMLLAAVGRPVVAVLSGATNLVLRLLRIRQQADPHLTEEEIRAVISQGAATGAIEETEETIVQRVLQLGELRVAAMMTPRLDIEWVEVDASPDELREFLASHSHTQFVVCNGSLDNVLGIVWAAELLPVAMRGRNIDLRSLIREAVFVPDSVPALKLLESFRASHRHIALVMDEFGAVEGLVTVTDLLEALVGHLPANAREAESQFTLRADGSWLVDGAVSMEDAATKLGLPDLPEEEFGAYHTMAGFVLARLGRVPKPADHFEWGGFRFEVVDMDGRRIDKVLVERIPYRPPSGVRSPKPEA
jgi:putative hemolysin